MPHRTPLAQRRLDPILVVPTDVWVQRSEEFFDRRGQPVTWVELLIRQRAEEVFARHVVW